MRMAQPSPDHFECQLNIAWLIALSAALHDLTKCRVGWTGVITARERRMISRIERIYAELRMEAFINLEALRQAHVDIFRARIADTRIDHVRMNAISARDGDKGVGRAVIIRSN